MNAVDSSAWLEYFAGGPNAGFFAPAVENPGQLVVPVLTLYEVFKRVMQQRDETSALGAVAAMCAGRVVEVDSQIALDAARISVQHKLPMADSIIYATARLCNAVLWTQDADLKGLPGVQYRQRKP